MLYNIVMKVDSKDNKAWQKFIAYGNITKYMQKGTMLRTHLDIPNPFPLLRMAHAFLLDSTPLSCVLTKQMTPKYFSRDYGSISKRKTILRKGAQQYEHYVQCTQ